MKTTLPSGAQPSTRVGPFPPGRGGWAAKPGQAPGHPTGGRHHVDVGPALSVAGEGDQAGIGRKSRAAGAEEVGGEPAGGTAGGGHRPQVVLADEDHHAGGDGGEPQVARDGHSHGRGRGRH